MSVRAATEVSESSAEASSQPTGPRETTRSRGYDQKNLSIGRHTYWGNNLGIQKWLPSEKVTIGKYCSISDDVTITTGGGHRVDTVSTYPFDTFDPTRTEPCRTYQSTRDTTIGNDVWIGKGAVISNGAQIGDGAVIGTRAVVFSDVPAYGIVAGNPAQVLRYRFSRPVIDALLRIRWWDWADDVVTQRLGEFFGPIEDFVAAYDPGAEYYV